jgi:hypothetical protein
MQLEYEMTYLFTTKGPVADTGNSSLGKKEYWEMSEGTLTGQRINAKILMPGGDWLNVSPDKFNRPNVRVQLITDDGAFILLSYTGLVQATNAFATAAENNSATSWDDQYMRMVMTFECGDEKYRWLTQSLFIAEGRIHGKNKIEYRIYRVT